MKWFLLAYFLFEVDNKTKRRAEEKLKKGGQPVPVLGGKFLLQRMSNKGMAGGTLSEKSDEIRKASTAAASIIGLNFLIELTRKGRPLSKIASSLLIAGAAGNLYDRWARGSVTDFLRLGKRFGKLSGAVFNFADTFILSGGFMMILSILLKKGKKG
ncbi:MAG: signal peptidase II [Lachnospiraceae bacterium]|nr:signal peptidase II [Lachnospiraceae bacterium]